MYSFDVFDTLVSRTTYNPKQIFSLMQEYICQHSDEFLFLSDDCKKNFGFLREEAEDLSSIMYADKEVVLEQIYDSFFKMTGESTVGMKRLMELEIQFEIQNSIPIDENISHVKELIESGEDVILISDMYLKSEIIRKILVQHDDVFDNLPIYVSCECNASKANGMLYVSIKNERGISYNNWTHIGDNEFSDGCIPQLLGINARMIKPKEKSKEYLVGYTTGGYVFFPYVKWIIEMCIEKEYTDVYFVARDGYVLKRIADIIIEHYELDMETHYIYLSRNAAMGKDRNALKEYIAQETNNSFQNSAWVDLQGTGKTLEVVSEMFHCVFNVFYYYLMESDVRRNNYSVYASRRRGNIIETLCRAPHGVTIGYKYDNNKWEALLEKDYQDEEYENRIIVYANGVSDFSKKVLMLQDTNDIVFDFRKKSKEILDVCFDNPSNLIASFIGDIYHGNSNEPGLVFSPKLEDKDIREYYNNPQSYKGVYYDYSLKRATKEQQELDKCCRDNMRRNLKQYITEEYDEDRTNVILYGAGKNSWKKVIQYGSNNKINVVAWTDADAKKCKKEYEVIIEFHKVHELSFDYVIITVSRSINTVKELLIEAGIDSKKIITSGELEAILAMNNKNEELNG